LNAPTTVARSLRRRLNEARAEARALAIVLWCEGRSVAGILMETARETGHSYTPKALLKMLHRARRRDAAIPPPLRTGTDNALDTRADLFPGRVVDFGAAQGPWDGDEANQ